MKKKYEYNRYTIRLNDDMTDFVKEVSEKRSISPTALIKYALGEYRDNYEKQQAKD